MSTSLLVSVCVALAIGVIISAYFLRPSGSGEGNDSPRVIPARDMKPGPNGLPPKATGAITSSDERAEGMEPDNRPKGETGAPRLRLLGAVSDPEGQPIAGVRIRWVPTHKHFLEPCVHDGKFMSRLPPGKLKMALSESKETQTNEKGTYDFTVPASDLRGAVLADCPGYQFALREIEAEAKAVQDSLTGERDAPPKAVTINFTLGFACTISGKVRDKLTGDPAAGMIVCAGGIDPDAAPMLAFVKPDAPSANVGEDGTYLIQGLVPGEYRVVPRTGKSMYASIPSRQAKRVLLERGVSVTDVDFEVVPGGRIYGTVSGPDGQPLEDADCVILPSESMQGFADGDMETRALLNWRLEHTKADGRYEIAGLALERSYRVMARLGGATTALEGPIKLTAEQMEARVDFVLKTGFSIEGHVSYKDRTPAPGMDVYVIANIDDVIAGKVDASIAMNIRTVTDDDGAFKFSDLPPGTLNLYAGNLNPSAFFLVRDKTTPVVIDGSDDVTYVEILIEDSKYRLAGTVVDNWGNPVGEAAISIALGSNVLNASSQRVSTEEDGTFAATVLGAGPYLVAASKKGYSVGTLDGVEPNTTDLLLTIRRHGTVSGRIITPDGVFPSTGAWVKAKLLQEEPASVSMRKLQTVADINSAEMRVDSTGAFRVEAPPGTVKIHAVVPGFAPACSKAIAVLPGEEHTGVKIMVTVGSILRGRVVLGDNRGVEGATVRAQPTEGERAANVFEKMMPDVFTKERNTATTNSEGLYEIANLPGGTCLLTATHPEYAPSDPETVTVGHDEIREVPPLVMSMGGVLAGIVIENDKPKTGVMAQLVSESPLRQAFVDKEGRFRLERLKPGEYLLNVVDLPAMQRGRMVMKSQIVSVEKDATNEIKVVFGVGYKVFGTVEGLPHGAMQVVTLRRPGGPAPEELNPLDMKLQIESGRYQAGLTMVDTDNRYEILDIEPGTYILEVPVMPKDPMDIATYTQMDRTPLYRRQIKVGDEDIEVPIKIK